MRALRGLPVALLVVGCMSSGVQIKESQLAQFERGKTTYNEAVSALGTPTTVTLLPDGGRQIAYVYVQAQARPESFIPFIGPFVGGVDSRSNAVALTFDPAGRLTTLTSSASEFGAGMGAAAGAPIARTSQPSQAP